MRTIDKWKGDELIMTYETIIYEKTKQLGIIKLNRPERLNAINNQLAVELIQVLDNIAQDQDVRAVILTGVGRAFCAGADIKEIVDPMAKKLTLGRGCFFDRLEALDRPVIAAINGLANGGGVELVLACDFRIAAETASFGFGEVNIGVIPAGGGTARLPRLIGIPKTKEMLYFGKTFGVEDMYRCGLVNKVVPNDQLMKEAYAWAAELREKPPLSLKMLKSCINNGMQMDIGTAIDYEAKCIDILNASEDRTEGVKAFVEKRKPIFKGK
jgi:enoyl-CoA hydratase